jgi:hypothetical protein
VLIGSASSRTHSARIHECVRKNASENFAIRVRMLMGMYSHRTEFRILSGISKHIANSMLIKWLCRGPFRGSHVLRIIFVCLVRWVSGGVSKNSVPH